MGLSAKSTGKGQDQPQAGLKSGRLVGLVDLGHQPGYVYQGEDIQSKYKIRFTYELVTSMTEDNRPHWVHEDVNVSNYEGKGITSTMMKRVRALDPTMAISNNGKNLKALIGSPCMVEVTINEGGWARVSGVSGVPEDYPVAQLANDPLLFNMEEPDFAQWDRLPEFIQKRITEALDYSESGLESKINDRANAATSTENKEY